MEEQHRKAEEGPKNFEHQSAENEVAPQQRQPRVGRNDPCPCGSGKKYKQCCGKLS